jgi:hypothetical protein
MGIALSSGRNEDKFDHAVVILHAKFAEAECTTEREKGEATVSRLFHSAFLPFGGKASSRLIVIGPTQLELPMLAKGAATTMFLFKVVPSDAI